MKISLLTRLKCLFVRDKFEFWFNEFTDEETRLKNMDAWELASVIEDANNNAESQKHRIVAEHLLNVRLAKISTKPMYFQVIGGFVCAILGALLSASLEKQPDPAEYVCRCETVDYHEPQISGSIPCTAKVGNFVMQYTQFNGKQPDSY
ncbi:hypothetical protein [Desulfogranum marinum]|uniref:hypothetical protein n=1 Tax=Desulfogranum marinum TaxID=453220 RepID=UPI0019645019|nr:hypothetical protein [Desulfogranum marinum]MBM9515309.1 hypothetical protein [Desulfogranum marinum]